jgi:hypothetical protein
MQVLSAFLFLLAAQTVQPVVVPAGTQVDARLESHVETATSSQGDSIIAVVAEPIRAGGKTVVVAGSRLNGRVETIEPASETSEGRVRLVFREIEFPDGRTYPAWITNSFSASPPNRKLRYALYLGIGATAGALLGGKNARTTGILGGSLIGFVIGSNADDGKLPDLELKRGRRIRLQLGEDLKMEQRED